jgi:hypothetical protein
VKRPVFLFHIFRKILFFVKKNGSVAAIVPALGEGTILVSFLLILIIGLPITTTIKDDITVPESAVIWLRKLRDLRQRLKEIFGGLAEESLTYPTIALEVKSLLLYQPVLRT